MRDKRLEKPLFHVKQKQKKGKTIVSRETFNMPARSVVSRETKLSRPDKMFFDTIILTLTHYYSIIYVEILQNLANAFETSVFASIRRKNG